MSYNKNIVLEMISSTFWDEIETFVEENVMDFEGEELMDIFSQPVDYALLDSIESMRILDFDTDKEEKNESISGTLQVVALVEGYVHWDGENVWLEDEEMCMGIAFSFDVVDGICSNLDLARED